MSGMDSIGKVWDGYEWVLPAPEKPKKVSRSSALYEPSGRRWGLAADAYKEKHEAQRQLVALQREVQAKRARRARIEHLERQEAVGRSVRQEQDVVTGRTAQAEFVATLKAKKVQPADAELLDEFSQKLNASLAEDGKEDTPTRDDVRQRWNRLFKEMDTEATGRVGYQQFKRVAKEKLRALREREAAETGVARGVSALLDAPLSSLDEVGVGSPAWKQQQQANRRRSSVFPLPMPKREFPTSDDLLSVWRALDDVETGTGMRGYITLAEFNAFMRRGMPECDERQGERWRLRNAERKKEIGRAVRAERSGRGAEAASAGFGDASARTRRGTHWR